MGRQTRTLASFLSFLLICRCSSTSDTISFNQTLKDGDFLFSDSKSFVLGFFTPQNSIGNRRYIGIWFQQIPVKTIVWVANRDSPVNGESGVLFIDAPTGNLVIRDEKTNASVWSTNLTGGVKPGSNYSGRLLNNGNLVLGPHENEIPAWQSFDFPTNTLLPSMKLSVDKKPGGLRRVLTSWKSADDPGTGQYALGMELSGAPQVFLYRSWAQIWRAGPWNGVELSGSPEISQINPAVNLNYTETDGEVSLTFSLRDQSVLSMLVLNESGTVNRLTWQGEDKGWVGVWSAPEDKCDVYDGCGAFSKCDLAALECSCLPGFEPRSGQESSSDGCTRGNNTDASSLCHKGEGFAKLSTVKLPDAKTAVANHHSIGLKECNQICLNNCSCTGYTTANVTSGGGCITWYGELIDIRELANGGQDLYIRISVDDLRKLENISKGRHHRIVIAVSLAVVSAALILLLCCLAMHIRKGKRRRRRAKNKRLQSYGESVMGEHVDETGSTTDVSIFALKTIQLATDNFSVENKLGQGGFGSVYKGKLPNGRVVAVKRLSRTSGQGVEEFKNEVTLIAKLQHRNLVRLLGCCIQQGEKMLVYEYMPNNSLDHFIFDANRREEALDWTRRFDIIVGIARGLLYLHRDSRLRIIHRDLKPSNVLLDASMTPKISDFGMARIFGIGQNEANTNRVVGTYGYMSPEYAMEGQFSVKSDVFSFGVLLLEIVCGRKNKNPVKGTSLNLMGDVWDSWREGKAAEIVDPLLGESYDGGKVLRCIHVGLLCVQATMNDRPTMSQVVFMLCNETNLPNPNPPGFILLRQQENCIPSSSTTSITKSHSINDMTVTEIEGR